MNWLESLKTQQGLGLRKSLNRISLSKLQREHPAGLEKSYDPDFQYALFTVQKEYARNGDKDLGDLLVDLLVTEASRSTVIFFKLS